MTHQQAIALAQKLPAGWLALADAKLRAKGTPYSQGMISRVKTAKHQNEQIEEVLFEVAAEEAARLRQVDERIAALSLND